MQPSGTAPKRTAVYAHLPQRSENFTHENKVLGAYNILEHLRAERSG